MNILTAEEMREVDRLTMERGIPGIVLMENAGHRVVEVLAERFAPLSEQRIVIVCGKGNNGGDGLVIARQLFTRFGLQGGKGSLHVLLAFEPAEFQGDALANYRMLVACGCSVVRELPREAHAATLVIDALLGTGLRGPATGRALDLIRLMNTGFPGARIVSVDIPSGLVDGGESVRAELTVTFTAPKREQMLPPTCDRVGELIVAAIGSPEELIQGWLHVNEPRLWTRLLAPRAFGSHKGTFGHVLVVGGASGKAGAAIMAGAAALRAGAGLVTVGCHPSAHPTVTAYAPELMTQAIEDDFGGRDIIAIGPGLGLAPEHIALVQRSFGGATQPMVLDADALNALAGTSFVAKPGSYRVLTPHPGEMSRLLAKATDEFLSNRLDIARTFAMERRVVLVLKGQRTLIAFPDGRVFVNPTGTPAMASGGSGDILTGLIAGLMGQFPGRYDQAVLAAVWLHGRCGQLAAAQLTEKVVTATDLLDYLPEAIRDAERLSHAH